MSVETHTNKTVTSPSPEPTNPTETPTSPSTAGPPPPSSNTTSSKTSAPTTPHPPPPKSAPSPPMAQPTRFLKQQELINLLFKVLLPLNNIGLFVLANVRAVLLLLRIILRLGKSWG